MRRLLQSCHRRNLNSLSSVAFNPWKSFLPKAGSTSLLCSWVCWESMFVIWVHFWSFISSSLQAVWRANGKKCTSNTCFKATKKEKNTHKNLQSPALTARQWPEQDFKKDLHRLHWVIKQTEEWIILHPQVASPWTADEREVIKWRKATFKVLITSSGGTAQGWHWMFSAMLLLLFSSLSARHCTYRWYKS